MNRTKIIATLGPSTFSSTSIQKLIETGVDIFRLNMSHIRDQKVLQDIILTIKNASKRNSTSTCILLDLGGPKIRIAHTLSTLSIKKGKIYTIGKDIQADLPINYSLRFAGNGNTFESIQNYT